MPRQGRGKFLCPQGRRKIISGFIEAANPGRRPLYRNGLKATCKGMTPVRILIRQAAGDTRHGSPGGKLPLSGAAGPGRSIDESIDRIAGPTRARQPAMDGSALPGPQASPPGAEDREPGARRDSGEFRGSRDLSLPPVSLGTGPKKEAVQTAFRTAAALWSGTAKRRVLSENKIAD